jgi:hypothetical protein
MGKVPENERQAAAAHVAKQTKGMAKKFYVDRIKEKAKVVPAELATIYMKAIKIVEAM